MQLRDLDQHVRPQLELAVQKGETRLQHAGGIHVVQGMSEALRAALSASVCTCQVQLSCFCKSSSA